MWSQKKADAVRARFDPDAERIKEGWGPAANLAEPDPPENLTLFNAVVWAFAESSGMRLPVVRVRIDAVTAWWTGGGEPVKGAGGQRQRLV